MPFLVLLLITLCLILPLPATADEMDPAYRKAAEATGGKVYLTEPDNVEELTEMILKDIGIERQGGYGNIDFYKFDFVEPNLDIHGGYFPVEILPLAGEEAIGEVVLLGPYDSVSFYLVNEDGDKTQDVILSQNFPAANPDHFFGHFTVPETNFRVVAEGYDKQGNPFLRYSQDINLR